MVWATDSAWVRGTELSIMMMELAGQSPRQIMHTFVFTYTAPLGKLVMNLELQCMTERGLR